MEDKENPETKETKESKNPSTRPFHPIFIPVIVGLIAAIPAMLTYINTPRHIEGEIRKLQEQGQAQLELQKDRHAAEILARLDEPSKPGDPKVHVRSGAALSLAVVGGEESALILAGELREAALEVVRLSLATEKEPGSTMLKEAEQEERVFIDSLEQALLTMGVSALGPLVDVNVALRLEPEQLPVSADELFNKLGSGRLRQELAQEQQMLFRANIYVKDTIRALLVKVAPVSWIVSRPGVTASGSSPSLSQFQLSKYESRSESPIAQKGISMANVDLSYAVLTRLDLRGVNLVNADLSHSVLRGSDLRNADLRGAVLDGALLDGANLDGANLEGTILSNVQNFSGAMVSGANFAGTVVDSSELREHLRRNGAVQVP